MTLSETVSGATGLAMTLILGEMLFPWLVEHIDEVRGNPSAPPGFDSKLWADKIIGQRGGGRWLGWFERIILFIAFWVQGAAPLAGAWLAFKVVSKWESWKYLGEIAKWWQGAILKQESNTIRQDLSDGSASWLGLISSSQMTFVVGTGGNIVLALIGVFIGRLCQ